MNKNNDATAVADDEVGANEQENNTDDIRASLAQFHAPIDASKLDLTEDVVALNRVAKVVKGGRRFSFTALVVVGDGKGHVGVGYGKANEVPDAIQKGVDSAKKALIRVPRLNKTIPFEVMAEFGAARVMLKPASEGTGLIAGPAVRAVLEKAGVTDILTKVLGSENHINVVRATYEGLRNLELAEQVALRRGKSIDEMMGRKAADRYREARAAAETSAPDFHQIVHQEQSQRGTYSAGGRKGDS